jgi:hypothetical protein
MGLGKKEIAHTGFIHNQRLCFTLHGLSWIKPISQVTLFKPKPADLL